MNNQEPFITDATAPENTAHGNAARWQVDARSVAGDNAAVIGTCTVTDDAIDNATGNATGQEWATVSVYVSLIDGAIVVEVDTSGERDVPLRVNVNDHTELDTTVRC